MEFSADLHAVFSSLFSHLFPKGPRPAIRLCPAQSTHDLGLSLQGKSPELPVRPALVKSWDIEQGFLNLSMADAWFHAWLEPQGGWPEPRVEGHLRDAEVARHLREPRKGLRLFLRRLEHLPGRHEVPGVAVGFHASEKLVLLQQQLLVAELRGREQSWPPQLLGQRLEVYRAALVHFWEGECLDVDGDAGRTALRTVIWASQRSFLQVLLPALTP